MWPTINMEQMIERGIIMLTRGKVISRKDIERTRGSYPVYSSASLNNGKFGEYGLFMFDEELITWSVDGGGSFFYRPKHKFSVTNVGGILRILDRNVLDYRYLYYILSHYHARLEFDWSQKAHPSVIRRLYRDIPIPPLSEQKRIADILDRADALREMREQSIAKHDELLQSVFLDMFGDPVTNPKGWDVQRIGDTECVVQIGPFGSLLHRADYISGGVPLVNPMHIVDGRIVSGNDYTVSEEKASSLRNYRMQRDDVVMGRRGEMGRCAVVQENDAGMLCGTGSLFIRPSMEQFRPRFLFMLFSSASMKQQLEGLSQGVTMANLNRTMIADLSIPMPPLEHQQQFEACIDSIEAQRICCQESEKILHELFLSLQQKAFKGEL